MTLLDDRMGGAPTSVDTIVQWIHGVASCLIADMNTRPLMTMQVKVARVLDVGAVPHGTRRIAPLDGGTFEGPRLRGTVLPGSSADWLLLRPDGVLELDFRATLQTDDGASISLHSSTVEVAWVQKMGCGGGVAACAVARSTLGRGVEDDTKATSRPRLL